MDYLIVLFKWKKLIIVNCFVVGILAAALSLMIPKWYRSRTTILPPSGDSPDVNLSSLLTDMPFASFGFEGSSASTNLYIAILKSRTVMEAIVKKFNLMERYKKKTLEETVKALRKHVAIDTDDEDFIFVLAEAQTKWLSSKKKDRKIQELAMNMADSFIDELEKVHIQLKVEKARDTRLFIEKRYLQNLEDLSRAEETLKTFQEKNGLVSLPEQTITTIQAASELKAQIMATEIEMDVMKKYVGENHADVIKTKNQLTELRNKYSEFRSRKDPASNVLKQTDSTNDVFIPLDDVPEMGLEYARLFREVMLQEKLLEFLLPQYEEAKIKEAKDTPMIQILDRAALPEKKARPKRALMVIFWGFITFILSCFYAISQPTIKLFIQNIKEKK